MTNNICKIKTIIGEQYVVEDNKTFKIQKIVEFNLPVSFYNNKHEKKKNKSNYDFSVFNLINLANIKTTHFCSYGIIKINIFDMANFLGFFASCYLKKEEVSVY